MTKLEKLNKKLDKVNKIHNKFLDLIEPEKRIEIGLWSGISAAVLAGLFGGIFAWPWGLLAILPVFPFTFLASLPLFACVAIGILDITEAKQAKLLDKIVAEENYIKRLEQENVSTEDIKKAVEIMESETLLQKLSKRKQKKLKYVLNEIKIKPEIIECEEESLVEENSNL